MPQIDISAPSQDEDFDINDDSSASEANLTETETETKSKPVADFSAVKPTVNPFVSSESPAPDKPSLARRAPRRPSVRTLLEVVLAMAVIGLGLWSWNLYTDRQNLNDQLSVINANPQALVEKQSQVLISRVGLLMQLPNGDTPTVAGVSDAAAAKQQSAFFANAANGDKVLMYAKAGEAILYRPSTNKIILVAPLTFNSPAASTITTTTKK